MLWFVSELTEKDLNQPDHDERLSLEKLQYLSFLGSSGTNHSILQGLKFDHVLISTGYYNLVLYIPNCE
jgi:hypothetical protein